jgi:hypothetical protein
MTILPLGLQSWERTKKAVDLVRDRLLRATAALEKAGVACAVVGGNAGAAWVGRVDHVATRFTQDVDLLIRRSDLELIKAALEMAGFVDRHVASVDLFIDGPEAKARDAVHVAFAGEKVRQDFLLPAPDVDDSEPSDVFCVLRLDPLVRMKLTSFRLKDKVHMFDLLDVGLVDEGWRGRLPAGIAARLEAVMDERRPEG